MACDTTMPALPVTVPASGGYSGPTDIGAASAALVSVGQSLSGHMFNFLAARDAQVASMEAKFQAERAIKESELTTERAVNRINQEVSNVRAELQTQIQAEAAITRAAFTEKLNSVQSSALTPSSIELLIRRLLTTRPGAAVGEAA